ncbi:MAG: hypothetical protein HYV26_22420 [Candidatus Hydrogenedentes bacterium]|nr:hypothetical protein [Candidatus Hydrogenedentota bacterium]
MSRSRLRNQQGMALIFAMMAIIVILGSMGVVMLRVHAAKKETDHAYNTIVLEEAAQAGIDLGVVRLWNDYLAGNGNTTGNVASYKQFLDSDLAVPVNEDLNFNGAKDAGEDGNGDGILQTYASGYDQRGWAMLSEPVEFRDPDSERVVATIDAVHVARFDTVFASRLTIRAMASCEGQTKTAVQILDIGGEPFTGPQYPILANNINCIMCHLRVLSVDQQLNTDPSLYNTFDRVKVAALESLMIRTTAEVDSKVAGTLYTRGQVYKDNGALYSDAELASSSLRGYDFSDENGKITQNATGGMSEVALQNAGLDSSGKLEPFANLYRDYPLDSNLQTDGDLPDSFPAPYGDDNGNRMVDDDEFDRVFNTADGVVTFENASTTPPPAGSVTGGIAYGVPSGTSYAETTLPNVSTADALNALSTTGRYEGNLILVGNSSDPIQIDNTVAVDGDLVIKGPIKGDGRLLVRGNVYIVGDVTYADDPGMFGKYDFDAATGTYKENAFALEAGGSVMMGDYLTVRGVNHSSQNNAKYPTWSQYSIHARDKNRTNNVTVGSKTETLKWGYFDPYSVDAGQTVSGRPGQQFSFTTSELMLFNNMELEKAIADSSYVPRFYGLRESQPNNIYVYDSADEHSVRYSESGVKTLSTYLASIGRSDILDRAVYHYTSPEGNWMSESALRQIWYDDEMTRPSSGRDWKFDGLLYSNNSIFNICRSFTRHNSNTLGRMSIRGGVVAADLGMFVPGTGSGAGLSLLYDPRVQRFLQIRDTTNVQLTRMAFYFEHPATEAS